MKNMSFFKETCLPEPRPKCIDLITLRVNNLVF